MTAAAEREGPLHGLCVVSVEQGYDPREFGLVAFGGAGPMHANALADLIGASPVVIPPGPGVMSAFGFLTSDVQNEFSETYLETELDVDGEAVAAALEHLRTEAAEWLASEGVPEADRSFTYHADCRYYRQDIQLSVETDLETLRNDGLGDIKRDFEARHHQRFDFSLDAPLEIATLRVIGRGDVSGVELTERQRFAVTEALERGYYEWPRDIDGGELAEELDISRATLHEHLRKAERKLLTEALADRADEIERHRRSHGSGAGFGSPPR